MQNGAYTLAGASALGGLILLTVAGPDDVRTALGTALLLVALLLAGVGKGIDLLGYVQEGASRPDDSE
jgi:hypothetical protein